MRRLLNISFLLLAFAGCSKPLELPDTKPDTSILVVEGDIETGDDMPNTVLLSRVRSLQDTTASPVTNCQVLVVAEDGTQWELFDQNTGQYTANLNLPQGNKYKLRIKTSDGASYESVVQASKPAPPIDSVTFRQETPDADAVVFVHTHDPSNNTRYYRWVAEETWERHSKYEAFHEFVNGSIQPKAMGDQNFRCWKSATVPNITIANTNNLAEDVISYQPITTLTRDNEKVYVRYSILVKQVALTRESFDFWNTLRKNTELTGSLFDPQPSQYVTNITCTTDPRRKAIGFVSVSASTEARLFLLNSQLNLWPYENPNLGCTATEFGSKFAAEDYYKLNPNLMVAYYITGGGFALSTPSCVDCRLSGGDIIKPSFW
jgi:hypothetical protein